MGWACAGWGVQAQRTCMGDYAPRKLISRQGWGVGGRWAGRDYPGGYGQGVTSLARAPTLQRQVMGWGARGPPLPSSPPSCWGLHETPLAIPTRGDLREGLSIAMPVPKEPELLG